MIYDAIRISVYYCRTDQSLMAKANKACQHIHGSAFVVNDQIFSNGRIFMVFGEDMGDSDSLNLR